MRGRLAIWNGTPSVRIWPVGTRRMLGVLTADSDAEGDGLMPPAVQRLIQSAPFDTVVFGDYEVCSLTPTRRGWMQMVFIRRAERLVSVKR